jgi:CPA2 family monovalent cation:H+ antiporter-2
MNWTIAQIASVVLCAVGSGVILSSLGHSPILGYIIAGVVLGPSCLKFITDRECVNVFSEMGILFLLFAIGLGLSFEKVRNMWKRSMIVTIVSALFTYLAMFVVGYFLKIPQTGIILMTFCFTLSSTAVTEKSLKHLKNSRDGIKEDTFGILIFQDIAALVMVLVINFMGVKTQVESWSSRLIALLVFAAMLSVVFLQFNKYVHKLTNFIKRHSEMLTMFVFGFSLGGAVLSEVFGLSASFGAFIAGLILGNSSMSNEIKNIAAPIEEILLMTFFLSVGLLVDLEFIWTNFSMIFWGIMFVTLGKTIINIFVLRLCNFSLKESFVISVLLGHIGEFSFMLSTAASKVGLVNSFGVKFLVSLTALSLFFSPFWLIFAERCRTITESVNIESSWEFLRFALDRELHKTHAIVMRTTKNCVEFTHSIHRRFCELIDKIKNRIR